MDKRTFWSTKSPLPEFHAITFDHMAFSEPIRLVANQFAPVVLSGIEHTPAAMVIKPPDQTSTSLQRLTVSFPRQYVGRRFKQELAKVQAYSQPLPISVLYSVYLGDVSAPKLTRSFYVSDASGVQFNAEAVNVVATDDNPLRRSAAVIYDPNVWTGLELL